VTFFFTMGTLSAVAHPSTPPGVTIRVTGHQYWWEVEYVGREPSESFTTANELHVPVGVPVRLELVAGDVIHSFWVPQLAGKTDLIPGQRNVMWIQAERPGRYYGHCAEYCGAQHANMEMYVIAEPKREFESWLARERQAAPGPAQMSDATGYAVFQRVGCANCHTIRGTTAGGRVGPDLTHLASRTTIGAGVLPNTRGNLAGWIANAQAIKPGIAMPTMGESLAPNDLQHLLAYLETLR
jgi:cytochrome c oxidase subunit 2